MNVTAEVITLKHPDIKICSPVSKKILKYDKNTICKTCSKKGIKLHDSQVSCKLRQGRYKMTSFSRMQLVGRRKHILPSFFSQLSPKQGRTEVCQCVLNQYDFRQDFQIMFWPSGVRTVFVNLI